MSIFTLKYVAFVALPLILGGCVSSTEYSATTAGFSNVANMTAEATEKTPSGCRTAKTLRRSRPG